MGETSCCSWGPFCLVSEKLPFITMAHGFSKEFNLSRDPLKVLLGVILKAKHPF